jgi:hypothetical protein
VRGGVREGPSWCVVAAQRGYADSDRHRRIRVDDADWPPRWHHRKTRELAPHSEKGEITSALVVTRSDRYLRFPGNPDAFTELVNAVSAGDATIRRPMGRTAHLHPFETLECGRR